MQPLCESGQEGEVCPIAQRARDRMGGNAELEAEHRSRRDALLDFYDEHGLEAAPSLAGYDIEPIADAAGAQRLLLAVETNVTTAWRAGVASTEPRDREICLRMYGDAAVALARWRIAVGESAADPWPGRPE